MTGTPTTAGPPRTDDPRGPVPPARTTTAWTGWIVFAGIMLMLVGTFQLVAGLVAIFQDGYYLVSKNGLVVHADYTAWGWTHIVLATLNVLAGLGVLSGRTWARIWAILVAGVSAIVNLGFTSAYPVWVVMMVTLDVIVIYALSVHWDEMRSDVR